MMERLIVVFITAAVMCGASQAVQHYSFAEPRADPNVKGHYSYSDPGAIFHVTYETDKKTSSKTSSPERDFSEIGSFGGHRNTHISDFNRPIYIVNTNNDEDKFEEKVNYKIASTTSKPSYKFPAFQFTTTPSPAFNSLPIAHANKPGQSSFRPLTTKFSVNHPHPPSHSSHSHQGISSRYQQYSQDEEEEYVETKREKTNTAPVSDKYLNDYQQALSKLQAASTNIARRPNAPKSQIKYVGPPSNSPNSYLPKSKPIQFSGEPDAKLFKPKFKLQKVPNLYPRDDAPFKPSVGYPNKGAPAKQEFYEVPEYVYSKDDVQYYNVDGGASPPAKSQNPQYLKRQNQMKHQPQLAMEKLKKSRNPYSFGQASQTNFRPIAPPQPPHRFSMPRRKPSRAFTPAGPPRNFKTRPLVDGPYSIRISM